MFQKELEIQIGYEFSDDELIFEALTHSSYANEIKNKDIRNNERLEFLGDSVLSLVISEYIFKTFPEITEGKLTKIRSKIVCEATLAQCAKDIKLGNYLKFGKGEEMTGGRKRVSILADAFEALIAAIYLDGGYESVKLFILNHMKKYVEDSVNGKVFLDYKTHFQELVQNDKNNKINYEIFKEEGPDHRKVFFANVLVNDLIVGTGSGKSKKEAEQEAAKDALEERNCVFKKNGN